MGLQVLSLLLAAHRIVCDELSLGLASIHADRAEIEKLAFPGSEDFLRGSLRGAYELDGEILSLGVRWQRAQPLD